jgi:hypothetical protein
MDQGPNQPQNQGGPSGGRRRRRRRGAGKKPHQSAGAPPQQHSKQSNPGNGGGGGGANNRRNRGRRQPAAFVGPMDHSYRNGNANGNMADGNGQGGRYSRGSQQIQPKFVPNDMTPVIGRGDAPARIFCFIEDLFFFAKIQEVSKKLNIKVEFVKTPDVILERAAEDVPETDRPALVIFDLNNFNAKPLTTIPKLRSKLKKATSIIGFVSHIQGDLKMKALEAGCDTVMPRSAFSQNLPNLLRRHGAPEEVNDGTDQQHFIQ